MAYTTQAAIESAIGVENLAALCSVDGSTVAAVCASAIADVEATINSYGRKLHAAERLARSTAIAGLAARMAVRNLRRDRRMSIAQDALDEVTDRKWLEALAKGLVTLDSDHGGETTELVVDKAGERSPTLKAVSRNRLKGFW